MALGLSATAATHGANAIVDSLDGTFMQLHTTGEPGAAGTANIATETDRMAISLNAAVNGAATNDGAIVWTGVAANEDYLYYTLWSASTGGTFRFSGLITADAVLIGNTFTIAVGQLSISITTVAT